MEWRLTSRRGIAAAVLMLIAFSSTAQTWLELTAGIHRIRAEVANTSRVRAEGLMFREVLPTNSGMLFVFDGPAQHCMWMRNTLIPLSVAFIDDKGVIINVEEMFPQTEDNHCAARPAKFALEMNAGWFKGRGLGQGVFLTGIDKVPAAR